jgi:tol-pal system protein YbgF
VTRRSKIEKTIIEKKLRKKDMRTIRVFATAALITGSLLASSAFGASREEQEMQRDIAQLQDQVRTLQSSSDQKLAAIQTLVQQAFDAATRANTAVSVLGAGVSQTLQRELGDRLTPVAGLSTKVDSAANDVAEIRSTVSELTVQMNKILQQLSDINNAIKVIQAPAAAPPGALGAGAQPPAQAVLSGAILDYSSNKLDLAVTDFTDFLRLYPDDPQAPTAQLYLGETHSLQHKYDLAAADFDTLLQNYPDSKVAPDAFFMKATALKNAGKGPAARAAFQALIKKYPTSDQAKDAQDQLKSLAPAPKAN